MSEENKEIEVVLDDADKKSDDTPKVEIVDEEPAKKGKSVEVTPDEGISELKKSLEREKQARLDAERRAHQASQQAHKASVDKTDSEYQLVVNAIETVKGRNEQLKTAYADAMNAGDYNRAAEIQSALAKNANQLSDLKRGKKAMKEQLKTAKQEIQQVRSPQIDIVEQLASSVSSRSAAWLRDSKEHLKGEREIRKMFRAHEDAIDDGIAPDTDEYFSFIENRLGINRHADDGDNMSAAAAPAPRKSVSPPPAPVSRGGQRPNVMRLTAAEAEMASSLGMSPEEYAKNKALAMKEGRYGH